MSNNSSARQQELKHIGSIVRALVTSRKPPCYLRDILKEYPEVESKSLPFKSLGYKAAQDLLEDTGEFIFNRYGNGDVIITAKYNKNSAHISSMVRGQKSSKSVRVSSVKTVKQPARMPARSSGFGDRNNNNFSNNNRGGSTSISGCNTNHQKSSQSQQQNQSLQRQKSMGSNSSGGSNNTQAKDLREMLNSKKTLKLSGQQSSSNSQQKATTTKQSPLAGKVIQPQQQDKIQQRLNDQQQHQKNQKQAGNPRPILGATKQQQTKESQNSSEGGVKRVETKSQQQQNKSISSASTNKVEKTSAAAAAAAELKVSKPQQRLNALQANLQQQQQQQLQQKQTKTATASATTQSTQKSLQSSSSYTAIEETKPSGCGGALQNRLKVQVKQDYQAKSTTHNHQYNNTPKIDYNAFPHHQFSNQPQKMDAISSVIQYCRSKNYQPPRFNVFRGKFSRGTFSCSVHVNDSIFSTYPQEYETEYLAKEACAKRALDKIKMAEKKSPLPQCTLTDTELLDKLYTELLNHPHGIFAKNLPETYESSFQQQLPDNWWALVQTSSLFTTETNLSKVIIFANRDADKDSMALCTGEATKTIQIDPIRLPWSVEYWDIFVTHCSSTVEVWGRLFGAEYNVRFSSLVNDIEAYMTTKKERPVSIARNNIYLVHINECWHRVRVEELDKSKGSALCFFIDFGDADWLPVDQLHICETHFLSLPAQAVPFSLYGLEDFEENPYARKCLDDLLPTKSLVGRIFTKENEFYDTNSKNHGKIQVVLFDTSSQEDVNMNHQLLNTICCETAVPEIKHSTVTNVIVTHIRDNGDIYLQVNSPELKYVQKLLQQIIESKFNSDQHKIVFEDLERSNLFLICDDEDANNIKWHRAALNDTNIQSSSDYYEMYYVDNGQTKSTNISKIFLLESLSVALSKFPAQAIKVRLHNIPDITANIVARIRGLLPKDCEALVRLSVPGKIPLVTIYTRLEGPGTLCTINDVIRIEHELEEWSLTLEGIIIDDTNNCTKSPHDINKKLARSTSGSSLASPTTPTTNPFIDVTRGLTLTKVPGSPQKSSDLPKLHNYALIPNKNEYFDVRITMSANPSNFTIQPYKEYPNLHTLMKELQEFCVNSDEFIPTDMVEIGEAYAAKNPDGFFHRVTVVKKYGDMIHVSFCDFGDNATLDSGQLKTLPLKFRQLPKMAIQARLYGIKPVNGGDWTLDDCLFFRKLTVGKTFVSVIKDLKYDKECTPPTQTLELELIDVTTDDDILIRELLLNEKRAICE